MEASQIPAVDPNKIRRQMKHSPPRERRKMAGQVSELVLDDERVDTDWEDDEADRIREAWEHGGRDEQLGMRRAARAALTPGRRLDQVTRALNERAGGMKARPVATGAPSADRSPTGNCPPGETEVDPAATHSMTLVEAHIRALEDILDAEDGLLRVLPEGDRPGRIGGPAGARMMTTEERDRIVWTDFAGIRSDQVASEAPWLGTSARTIERARTSEAARRDVRVRPVTGEVIEEAA